MSETDTMSDTETTSDNDNQIVLLGRTIDKLRTKSVIFSSTPSEPMIDEAVQSIRASCGNERVMIWELRGAPLPKKLDGENDLARKRLAKNNA
jgi:hypothetical protein